MLETTEEKKIKKHKERKAGFWFPFTHNNHLIIFQDFGKSIAFSIRAIPMLRKSLGAHTYTWTEIGGSFLWIRFWVIVSVAFSEATHEIPVFNLLAVHPHIYTTQTLVLSGFSFLVLLNALYWKVYSTSKFFISESDVDMKHRGYINPRFDGKFEKSFLNKEWFKNTVLEPLLFGVMGYALVCLPEFRVLGMFILISLPFYILSEGFYHYACGKLFQHQRSGKQRGESSISQHDRYDQNTTIYD